MAIDVTNNAVCLTSGLFCQTPTGVRFTGEAQASQFCSFKRVMTNGNGGVTFGGVKFLPATGTVVGEIECYPFASDTSGTIAGNLATAVIRNAGAQDGFNVYSMGGRTSPGSGATDSIEKMPGSNIGLSTDVGELTVSNAEGYGHSSTDAGFKSGDKFERSIQKFPFASLTAVNLGIFDTPSHPTNPAGSYGSYEGGTASSDICGYRMGGVQNPPFRYNQGISKFSFATGLNSGTPTNLTPSYGTLTGGSSLTHGYNMGGFNPPYQNSITRFPFAADAPVTSDIGDLLAPNGRGMEQGSTSCTHIYVNGGYPGPRETIQKFPFTSPGNASDVGELTEGKYRGASGSF